VDTNGSPDFNKSPVPKLFGEGETLITAVAKVDQFLSGVFAGIPADIAAPRFRAGGLWTKDEELADIGDAFVEVRTFDTSFISVATADLALLDMIVSRLHERRSRRNPST
jgi:hypothetical protein